MSMQFLPDPTMVEHYLQPQLDDESIQRLDGLLHQHKYLGELSQDDADKE